MYDDNGNLKKDDQFDYKYNALDQLIEVTTLSGQLVAKYDYDEEGRRISKQKNGETIFYHYYDNRVLYETDENDNILVEYAYDDKGLPVTMTKDGQSFYYLLNHHGDVVALTDSTGAVVASYSYDAWGNIISQTGPMASDNPFRYAGYRYDEDTKLYYLMARYYNPENGVFLSKDPVFGDMYNPLSQNGYGYANNNPVMMVDPDGSYAISLGASILIPGVGWITLGAVAAVIGGAWLIVKYGIPWAKKKYENWYFTKKYIDGWDVIVDEHYGKTHAHWKKGNKKGSVNKDGTPHHKGESKVPPTSGIKDFLRKRGFKV
jgi:RHS repeat-associated protein